MIRAIWFTLLNCIDWMNESRYGKTLAACAIIVIVLFLVPVLEMVDQLILTIKYHTRREVPTICQISSAAVKSAIQRKAASRTSIIFDGDMNELRSIYFDSVD